MSILENLISNADLAGAVEIYVEGPRKSNPGQCTADGVAWMDIVEDSRVYVLHPIPSSREYICMSIAIDHIRWQEDHRGHMFYPVRYESESDEWYMVPIENLYTNGDSLIDARNKLIHAGWNLKA